MTDSERQRGELDDVGGVDGGDTSREVPESEQTGPEQADGSVSHHAADPDLLTWLSRADLETEESGAEEAYVAQNTGQPQERVDVAETHTPVVPEPAVNHPEQGRWSKARSAGAVGSETPRVGGQTTPAPVQGPLPADGLADTPGVPVAVGYVTPMRGSGVRHWLAWGLRIYVIALALLILFTGVSMINAEGVGGWVPLGSLVLGIGMLLPMFYYGVARERDRQQFVRRLTEARDVTVDLREKDTQALVYSASLPATLQRTKRNWVLWGTVSAVIIVIGLFLLVQGLEASAFTYYPGGFTESEISPTSVSAI